MRVSRPAGELLFFVQPKKSNWACRTRRTTKTTAPLSPALSHKGRGRKEEFVLRRLRACPRESGGRTKKENLRARKTHHNLIRAVRARVVEGFGGALEELRWLFALGVDGEDA